jgi:hypothetical protein
MGFRDLFKSNFARIAENTTKYYLELKTSYGNRFSDEICLLATAGVLDAQNYVFVEHSIDIDTIIDMAKRAVSENEEAGIYTILKAYGLLSAYKPVLKRATELFELQRDPLFQFILSLEVALFIVDNPRFSSSDIGLACCKKANTISNAIRKTKKKYRGEGLFALAVARFMESPEFQQVRKQLGIKRIKT